jgi:hypothetical protein
MKANSADGVLIYDNQNSTDVLSLKLALGLAGKQLSLCPQFRHNKSVIRYC